MKFVLSSIAQYYLREFRSKAATCVPVSKAKGFHWGKTGGGWAFSRETKGAVEGERAAETPRGAAQSSETSVGRADRRQGGHELPESHKGGSTAMTTIRQAENGGTRAAQGWEVPLNVGRCVVNGQGSGPGKRKDREFWARAVNGDDKENGLVAGGKCST